MALAAAAAGLAVAARVATAGGEAEVNRLLAASVRQLEAGDLEAALRSARRAVRLAPDNPVAHNNAAVVFDRAGHHDLAMQELRVAVHLDPDYEEAHYNLAHVYLELARQLEEGEDE
ncbi:MAG: tetratricopeptide repeat protein [Nitrospirae bacterium]|nr:MAG: tetratricopeptide repeat protein [Nitrospirota bacterium]